MNPPEKIFNYSRDNEMDSRIFPIDYTMDEFSKIIKSGGFFPPESKRSSVPRGSDPRTIDDKLRKQPFLKTPLENMFRSNIKSSYAPRSYNIPIPFEAGPFLACVYKLGLSVKEPNVSNDQLQELFEMLYEIAVPSTDDQDINDFYRYICFQNAHFTTAVLVKLWEGELTERFENLKGLAKQKSIDLQICVLVDCLTSLDRCALFLKMQSETDSICEKNLSDTDNVDVVRHLMWYKKS